MRLFTAIDLSKEALAHVSEIQSQLKHLVSCRRWQKVDNVHLTLHFLGEVEKHRLPALRERIESVISKQSTSFVLSLQGWGAFPNESRPRVIWLGVGGELAPLINIQNTLSPQLKEFGYAEADKGYSPHITLARQPEQPIDWQNIRFQIPISAKEWKVESVNLYQSHMLPGGVKYEVLEKYPFS